MAIAVLALIGGFLSPVLLSTGENQPYILFSYIAILNLVALGAAYFRRWRGVDFLAFPGTMIMYQGWYFRFSAHGRVAPAQILTPLYPLLIFERGCKVSPFFAWDLPGGDGRRTRVPTFALELG